MHILDHFIKCSALAKSAQVRPAILYSTSSPATPSLKVSKSDADAALKLFGNGECNLLIATNVAEEGMDIPEANCVIYLDPIETSASYVQGRGCARQTDSSFVVMKERPDRNVALLALMEVEQNSIASTFQPKKNASQEDRAQRLAQESRKRGAWFTLSGVSESTSIAALNLHKKN